MPLDERSFHRNPSEFKVNRLVSGYLIMLECSADFRLVVTAEENCIVARYRARKGSLGPAHCAQ